MAYDRFPMRYGMPPTALDCEAPPPLPPHKMVTGNG
jgi:hypothetical protein